MKPFTRWLLPAVALAMPGGAHAQQADGLPAGARVLILERGTPRSSGLWLLIPGAGGVQGELVRATPDTLFLAPPDRTPGATRAIPRAALQDVYVRTGRSSRVAQVLSGVAVGALVFGGGEALTGRLADGAVSRRRVQAMAGVGAGLGAFLGATRPLDRWRRVRL
jgi:hypothetical protein